MIGNTRLRDVIAAARGQVGRNAPAVSFDAHKRTVLVTGATGFVGQHLVRALLQDGQTVIALSRQPEAAARLFEGRVSCVASMDALPLEIRIDVVVNLAGARILGPAGARRARKPCGAAALA